jgi:glycosyltransferase involved in cell wall biosynthesis
MRVVLIQKWVPHYRLAFLDQLRAALSSRGVELQLVYGDAPAHVADYDNQEVPWGTRRSLRRLRLGAAEVYWQAALRDCRGADLVIVEQANRLLVNYVLLGWQGRGGPRVACWAHGRNFSLSAAPTRREALKRRMAKLPSWWFAYTEMSRAALEAADVRPERITVVNNAIDTTALAADARPHGVLGRAELRAELGLPVGPVCLFLGTLYPEKRLDVLLDAADAVRAAVPDCTFVVAGAGADDRLMDMAARSRPWLVRRGPVFGADKAALLVSADLLLNPGRVGLGVLDSFVTATPMVTRLQADHAPEFAYVRDGFNASVVADPTPAAFAAEVVRLLTDDAARAALVEGARASAAEYTVEAMAERFASGVLQAVAAR